MSGPEAQSGRRQKALALIVVVYVMAALGTLAFALALRSRMGIRQARLLVDGVQQDEIALAACVQACHLLVMDDPNLDGREDIWAGWHLLEMPQNPSDANGTPWQVWWRLRDESAKINVNRASSDVLSRLKGLDDATVASILDWIDEDDVPGPDGAEKEYYAGLSPGYQCKNGPLETLDELMLIKGISPDTYFGTRQDDLLEDWNDVGLQETHAMDNDILEDSAGLHELLTVYGEGRINLNTASRLVLEAIPLLSDAAVEEILSRQQPKTRPFATMEDFQTDEAFTMADKMVLGQIARFNSDHFHLEVKIRQKGMPSWCTYQAFIERKEGQTQIVHWQRRSAPIRRDVAYWASRSERHALASGVKP